MNEFRLLKRSRQVTEYSCGASALQSVLSYWGSDVDEAELMKLLHTTEAEGTYPEDIVRGARSLGFEAEARDHLTLDEVQRFTAEGHPAIALAQAWLSEKAMADSVAEEWDTGHYVVILGVDEDYVYIQDPFARMSKAFMPRRAFEEHWHQVMGGDLVNNPKLEHLCIFVRGNTPARRRQVAKNVLAELVFRNLGSLNLMIAQFPRHLYPYDFLNELQEIWTAGNVRPDAFMFLRRDRNGELMGMEGSRLHDAEDIASINAVLAAMLARSIGTPEMAGAKAAEAVAAANAGDFGLSRDDMHSIAQNLPAGHSAIIILFENVWERRFREIAANHGGSLVAQRLISPDRMAATARDIAAAAAVPASPELAS
jgi:predicted double-glycine peptidase